MTVSGIKAICWEISPRSCVKITRSLRKTLSCFRLLLGVVV